MKDKKNKEITAEELEEMQRKEREEIERKEAEYQKRIEESNRKAQEAEIAKAKAEAMVEAVKNFQSQNGATTKEWTKEQWDEFEEKTKLNRESLIAIGNVMNAKAAETQSALEARMKQAEDRAKQAEEKFSQFERVRTIEDSKRQYFKSKPEYSKYEKDIDEFLNYFPEDAKKDPEKLKDLFSKAETYVRGKVGANNMRRDTGGSNRFGSDDGGEDNHEREDDDSYDLSELRSHERLTIEKIIPGKEKKELLKKYQHDIKGDAGIMYNTREEFDKYRK